MSTQQYFIVDPVHKGMVYRMLGNYWRQYKCAVTKRILKASRKKHKKRAIDKVKPANVKSQIEWDNFVKYRLGPEFRLLSEKFRKMRKKQEYTHTLSRMGYARLEHKMKTENPTEEVTRVKLWTKAHEKGGKPVNEVVGRAILVRKVWVDVVFDEYQTMEVYRATMDAKQLGEAVGSTLAWPKSSIKMLP